MKMITKKASKLTATALLLLATAACTAPQSTPNMVDYSYVPAGKIVSVQAAPGIEAF